MRVVRHLRAVTDEKHQPGMAFSQAHRTQDGRCGLRLGFGRKPALDLRHRAGGHAVTAQAQGIADQLSAIGRASRFDKGEGRHGSLPEPAPGPLGPRLDAGFGFKRDRAMAGGRHGRVQKGGQMHLQLVRPFGPMRDRQAEETRKADGVDSVTLAFQRPPQNLGPDVDAEGGLQRGPSAALGWPGQEGCQLALVGAVGGVLQDSVQRLVGGRQHGNGVGGDRGLPVGGNGRAMGQKRLFPDQPDCQKIGQRGIGLAFELRLPQQPARMHRPAAKVDQKPVERRRGRVGGQAQPVGRAQDGAFGGVGGFGHMGAEPGQPGDLGREIMGRPFPPGGKGTMAGPRCPKRLTPVEVACRPQPKAAVDHGGPVGAGGLGRKARHCGQRHGHGCGAMHPGLEPGKVLRLDR